MDFLWEDERILGREVGNGLLETEERAVFEYVLNCARGLEFDQSDGPR